MKKMRIILMLAFLPSMLFAQQPKIVSDATISFSVNNSSSSGQSNLGTKTIYIKGKDVKVDFAGNTFRQTIFYNNNTGNATILKEVGESKYISYYNADEWKKANEMYDGITISFNDETKKILNYTCKQAVLKLKNGNTYTVYYTPEIIPSVSENPFEFKIVPGLVLEYESALSGNEKIIYTANNINFDPVPSLEFEIPKKGYRILHN